jgi:hypothetical protein
LTSFSFLLIFSPTCLSWLWLFSSSIVWNMLDLTKILKQLFSYFELKFHHMPPNPTHPPSPPQIFQQKIEFKMSFQHLNKFLILEFCTNNDFSQFMEIVFLLHCTRIIHYSQLKRTWFWVMFIFQLDDQKLHFNGVPNIFLLN